MEIVENIIKNLLIPLVTVVLVPWLAKVAAKKGAAQAVAPVAQKVEHVIAQNMVQEKKIDEASKEITETKGEINGRLALLIEIAEKAAFAKGQAVGVEEERQRTEDKAREK